MAKAKIEERKRVRFQTVSGLNHAGEMLGSEAAMIALCEYDSSDLLRLAATLAHYVRGRDYVDLVERIENLETQVKRLGRLGSRKPAKREKQARRAA